MACKSSISYTFVTITWYFYFHVLFLTIHISLKVIWKMSKNGCRSKCFNSLLLLMQQIAYTCTVLSCQFLRDLHQSKFPLPVFHSFQNVETEVKTNQGLILLTFESIYKNFHKTKCVLWYFLSKVYKKKKINYSMNEFKITYI